ncbi:UrcA family protein [Sphingomonas sp. MMSM20]|uniref:UrcA family protein n=1 Tax=Sphingomonas lycopersici TaxID=2951807 RepID=UPI0015CD82FA|nr:UrcA family protein [Sphingomonas lycopersici]MCW6529742.1 UrcA family protein [Sphingomonas lycopersici]
MKTILSLAALAAAVVGAPAFAQSDAPLPSVSVRHADLDLSNPRDVKRLDYRIVHAVTGVCGTASSADPEGQTNVQRCRVETLAAANTQRAALLAAVPSRAVLASAR